MTSKNARYGIHLKKYCNAYEQNVISLLDSGPVNTELLAQHELKIRWLQHERLVHLIVTSLVSVLLLFSIWLFITLQHPLVLILMAFSLLLLVPYIWHYFYLENKVQSWYQLHDDLCQQLKQSGSK